MSFELTDDQKAGSKAFNEFMKDSSQTYLVIQGAAGSGKSTLIKFLLHSMETQYNLKELLLPGSAKKVTVRTELTATTNKAVAVLEELLQEQGVYRDTYVGPAAPDTDLEPDQDLTIYNDDKVRLTKYYGLVPRELLKAATSDDEEDYQSVWYS